MKDYSVTVHTISDHTFTIPACNSAEEAENIALGLFEDGEQGATTVIDLTTDIQSVEASL